MRSLVPIAGLLVLLVTHSAQAQRISFDQRTIVNSLHIPWEIIWGYDGWIWCTERNGYITRVHPETGDVRRILRIPEVVNENESGLLGLVLHPEFPEVPHLFTAYTYYNPDTSSMLMDVVRFSYEMDSDTLIEPMVVAGGILAGPSHNGCRLAIWDSLLYITTGEVWRETLAQLDTSRNGKILRVHLDGSIPLDNPWPGSPVWSKGHRNPQGLVFGPTGLLYSSEHGHGIDDEINLIEAGNNYGWPKVEGKPDQENEAAVFVDSNMTSPIMAWTPTIATSGLVYYGGDSFPEWKHSLIVAALKDESIVQMKLDSAGRSIVEVNRYHIIPLDTNDDVRRLRDLCVSPDGRIFVSTSSRWQPPPHGRERIFEITRNRLVPWDVELASPPSNHVSVMESDTLAWFRSGWNCRYNLQIASDASFSRIILDTTVTDTSMVFVARADSAQYTWHVREINTGGEWSKPRQFLMVLSPIPTLAIEPQHRAVLHTLPIELSWSRSAIESGYEIQLSPDSLFQTGIQSLKVQDTSYALLPFEDSSDLHWRVRARHRRGQWSETRQFSYLDTTTPPVPQNFEYDLQANFPNPFSRSTTFTVVLPGESGIALHIEDERGNRVESVANGQYPRGSHSFNWEPQRLARGAYWYVLESTFGRRIGKLSFTP